MRRPQDSDAPEAAEILCFGSADFEEPNWVNAQHLMWRLARRHRVLYVNSLGLRAPRPGRRDARKIGRRLAALGSALRRPAPDRHLFVLSPLTLPPARAGLTAWLGPRLLARQVGGALRRLGFTRPVAWAFLPSAAPVLERLDVGPIVYHCVDAYAANPGVDGPLIASLERRLLARAAIVVAASAPLQDRLAAHHRRVVLMGNVADLEAYPPPAAPPPEPADLAALPRPRIGYVGNLAAYKCDLALLADAARSRPHASWVFVGAVGRGEPSTPARALADCPNVHFLGERGRRELAGYIHHLDVCLIPFVDNEVTRHSFPMKFFEYLACGRPVVTADLPSLAAHAREPLAYVYRDREGFLPACDRALASDGPQLRALRRQAAEAHGWQQRVAEVEALLAGLHSVQRSS